MPTTPAQNPDDPPSERENLDKMLSANPDDYDTMLTWVKKAHSGREGESHDAFIRKRIDVLRKLYVHTPDHPEVLYGLAEVLYDVYPEQAIEYGEKLIKLDPNSPLIQTRLAWSYFEACQYEKALAQFKSYYAAIGEGRLTRTDDIMMHRLTKLLEGTDVDRKEFKKRMDVKHANKRKRLGLE